MTLINILKCWLWRHICKNTCVLCGSNPTECPVTELLVKNNYQLKEQKLCFSTRLKGVVNPILAQNSFAQTDAVNLILVGINPAFLLFTQTNIEIFEV